MTISDPTVDQVELSAALSVRANLEILATVTALRDVETFLHNFSRTQLDLTLSILREAEVEHIASESVQPRMLAATATYIEAILQGRSEGILDEPEPRPEPEPVVETPEPQGVAVKVPDVYGISEAPEDKGNN